MYVLFGLKYYKGVDVYFSYKAEQRLQTFGEKGIVG